MELEAEASVDAADELSTECVLLFEEKKELTKDDQSLTL